MNQTNQTNQPQMKLSDKLSLENIPKAQKVILQNKHIIDESLEDLGLKSTDIVKTRQRVASKIAQSLTEEDAIIRLQTAHRLRELEASESIKDQFAAIRDIRKSTIKRQEMYDEITLRRAVDSGILDRVIERQFNAIEDNSESLVQENIKLKAQLVIAQRKKEVAAVREKEKQ